MFIKLLEKSYVTSDILSMTFLLPECLANFIPGQYVVFSFAKNDKVYYRPYSVTSYDEEKLHLSICLRLNPGGIAGESFRNMPLESTVSISGPYGNFTLQNTSQADRLIFIATGTGMGPCYVMLDQLLQRLNSKEDLTVHFIHGVNLETELLYRDSFEAKQSDPYDSSLIKYHPRFKYSYYLSSDNKHRVQHGLYQLKPLTERDQLYLCGNPHMINEIVTQLDKEQTKALVMTERYS